MADDRSAVICYGGNGKERRHNRPRARGKTVDNVIELVNSGSKLDCLDFLTKALSEHWH